MRDCKIEVIKKYGDDALFAQYAVPGFGVCDAFEVGEVFLSRKANKPEGMCEEDWRSVSPYVFALAHGTREFFGGAWLREKDMAIVSCNDGLRPVVFKVTAV